MDTQEFWDDYQHLKKETSKLRLSEQRLKDIRARYKALTDGHADGVLVIDREGRLADLNPAAERLLDWDAAEVIGEPLDELLRDNHARELANRVQAAIGSDSAQQFDWTVSRLSGPPRQFAVTVTPVRDETRRVAAAMCVARDIGDLVTLEEDLDQAVQTLAILLEDTRRLHDRARDELDRRRR